MISGAALGPLLSHLEIPMAKMSMKRWEGSRADRKMDRKLGYKEGSRKDNAADRAAVRKINRRKGK